MFEDTDHPITQSEEEEEPSIDESWNHLVTWDDLTNGDDSITIPDWMTMKRIKRMHKQLKRLKRQTARLFQLENDS